MSKIRRFTQKNMGFFRYAFESRPKPKPKNPKKKQTPNSNPNPKIPPKKGIKPKPKNQKILGF